MEFVPSTKRSTRKIVHAVLVILLSFGLGSLTLPAGHVQGYTSDVLSAFGTATIDGVISPGEYGSCIGPVTQGIYVFTICETNDNHNDSYAIQINDLTGPTQDDLAAIFFDNGQGSIAACGNGVDDLLLLNGTTANPQFVDANYCATSGWNIDVLSGGTNDATMAVTFTPGVGYVYEVTHPLDSGDSKDYALTTSSTVGWCFIYYDGPSGTPQVQYPSGCFGAGPSVPSTAAGFGVVQKLSAKTALTATVTPALTALTDEVRFAEPPDPCISACFPKAYVVPLEAASMLVARAAGGPRGSSNRIMMLHGAIGQLNAFIAKVNARSGAIDAANGAGTASKWIAQANSIVFKIEAILNAA